MTVHELRPTSGIAERGGDSVEGSVGELWSLRDQQPIPEGNPPQSGRSPQGLWASVWPRVLAVLVVGSVGLPAAVASYWHLQEVAARFNPGSALAYWLPLSVDGLLAAALVVVWSRRTRGERVGFGPWAAFAFGMIMTLLANAASVVPESEWGRTGSALASVAAWMVALFPPVAFAISLELIAIVLRPTRAAARAAGWAAARTAGQAGAGGAAGRTATAVPAGQASTTAVGAASDDRAESSAVPMQSVRAARAAAVPAADQGDTAPLPVVVSGPARREDMPEGDSDDTAACTAIGSAVGETKLAKAEALLAQAWERGEDLSLAEVDRMIGGNRTAAKAKRRLRDRGLLPPAERGLPSPRAGVDDGAAVGSGRVGSRMVPA